MHFVFSVKKTLPIFQYCCTISRIRYAIERYCFEFYSPNAVYSSLRCDVGVNKSYIELPSQVLFVFLVSGSSLIADHNADVSVYIICRCVAGGSTFGNNVTWRWKVCRSGLNKQSAGMLVDSGIIQNTGQTWTRVFKYHHMNDRPLMNKNMLTTKLQDVLFLKLQDQIFFPPLCPLHTYYTYHTTLAYIIDFMFF